MNFSKSQWEHVKENSKAWWAGELKRPLIHIAVKGADPGRPEPKLPYHTFTAFYDLSIPAEDIVDRWDYELSCARFMGDSFPAIWPNFGAGVAAAFSGAKLSIGKDTVWFHPAEEKEIPDLGFAYNPKSIWLDRIKDICRAAMERWEGLVQVGMTDLGGNLDILSSFRPSEKLLLDLYDYPDEIKRLTWEVHEAWWRYFDDVNKSLKPVNPGYTCWTPIFSAEPYYMLQCDFCYMIGPDMFDEFVKPELAASCRRLSHAFYHLDGPGELPHLDSLLSIPELKGVQWIPGAGAPDCRNWPHVYRKIRDAGKLIQIFGTPDILDAVVNQLGSGEGIVFIASVQNESQAADLLGRYGVS